MQAGPHERALRLDAHRQVTERAAVAGEREAGVESFDAIQRSEQLADGVGRPAVVEVQRHAAEDDIAGDQQAALGQVQRHVRRRVSRRLDHVPRAEIGVDVTPSMRSRSGSSGPGSAGPAAAPALGVRLQSALVGAALACDLHALGKVGLEVAHAGA